MFENICIMFISMEPSAVTEKMDEWFSGILAGLRTLPFDFPGTTLNHARKVCTYYCIYFIMSTRSCGNHACMAVPQEPNLCVSRGADEEEEGV